MLSIDEQIENALRSCYLPCTPALVAELARITRRLVDLEVKRTRSHHRSESISKREAVKQMLARQGNKTSDDY